MSTEEKNWKEGQILLNILPVPLPLYHFRTLGSLQAFRKEKAAHQVLLPFSMTLCRFSYKPLFLLLQE